MVALKRISGLFDWQLSSGRLCMTQSIDENMDLNASTAQETLAWSLFRWWRGQLRHHCCGHLDMGPGGSGGPGWGPGPGGPGFGPRPGGFFGGFANGLCSMISSCFYCLCCCWLLQDCFGGPRGSYGPPAGSLLLANFCEFDGQSSIISDHRFIHRCSSLVGCEIPIWPL